MGILFLGSNFFHGCGHYLIISQRRGYAYTLMASDEETCNVLNRAHVEHHGREPADAIICTCLEIVSMYIRIT